ncbi:MAG: aldehyde ferredoxin oxidoreductase family protein [Candidatus Bathyarchaeia archaeon]
MELVGGYNGRILRINLTTENSKTEAVPRKWVQRYMGGRGIAARIYYEELSPKVDPLSPENKLIFFTGPLTGTVVPSTGKYECVTKSPLTGRYLCSNASGFFAPELKKAGYDGLIVEGKAKKPVYIWINDEDVEFRSAKHLSFKTTSETQTTVKEETNPGSRVMCIGPAGERLVRFACIQSDHRSFGRGGAGAVMGSKGLKAIAVKGAGTVNVYDPEGLRKKVRELLPNIAAAAREYRKHGTLYIIDLGDEKGVMPTRNFQGTVYNYASEKIGVKVMEKYLVSHTACYNCPIACGKLLEAKDPPYRGLRADVDYEIAWALGPLCGVFDYSPIIAAIHSVDEYGLDGISTGYAVSYAMELYERGIICKKHLNGLELRYGNHEALMKMIVMIAERKGFGDILAEGALRASRKLGENAEKYVMHVKGLSLTGWEPRAMTGMALAFATSSRGACHNVGGWTGRDELIAEAVDRFAVKGKGKLVKTLQDTRAYIDSLGLCTYMRSPLGFKGDVPDMSLLNLVTGIRFEGTLMEIGERIYNLERLILNREGVGRGEDDLPSRIKSEAVVVDETGKPRFLKEEDFQGMLDEYYEERGWTSDGQPTLEKLKSLKIP